MEFATYDDLIKSFQRTRAKSLEICMPLNTEDYVVQPFEHVSPPKWHLAHTTWFFERFILEKRPDYRPFDEKFNFLFNSYYKTVGEHWHRGSRGCLSRPTVERIKDYRAHVDEAILNIFKETPGQTDRELLEIGIHHEQQHQELLFMDIKSVLSFDPELRPYANGDSTIDMTKKRSFEWRRVPEGCHEFGHSAPEFSYDNERPRHKRHLRESEVSERLVTNGEFLEFIEDGGYERPELWMSKGWDWTVKEKISRPLYWDKRNDLYSEFTLYGKRDLEMDWPVQHISFFEADAFARWRGLRLPSEFEIEKAFEEDHIGERSEKYHGTDPLGRNELWTWTQDQYTAYPGYKSYEGSLGEYNRKFMCNQFVLRGGCYATPQGHLRNTYRNFYEPEDRWMFSGIRLARDLY